MKYPAIRQIIASTPTKMPSIFVLPGLVTLAGGGHVGAENESGVCAGGVFAGGVWNWGSVVWGVCTCGCTGS